MQVKTISYKRINNLGSYSSEHSEAFAELSDDDDPVQCVIDLKTHVEKALGLIAEPEPEPESEPELEENKTVAPW